MRSRAGAQIPVVEPRASGEILAPSGSRVRRRETSRDWQAARERDAQDERDRGDDEQHQATLSSPIGSSVSYAGDE